MVWISDDLRDRIAAWYEKRHAGDEYLFDTSRGTRVTENHLRRRVKRAARDAGINEWERVSPHTLRHTFATHYLRAVGDVERIRRALGHADISITQVYLHLADEDLEESMRAFANELLTP